MATGLFSSCKKSILIVPFLQLLFLCNLQAQIKAKIVQTAGGPQISINNALFRPRMFWGSNKGGTINVTEEWHEFTFEVNVPFEANSTWHFRFGKEAGEIWVKDVKLINGETGKTVLRDNSFVSSQNFNLSWNVYPPASDNHVGVIDYSDSTLHLTLSNPPNGEAWPDFHFYGKSITLSPKTKYIYSFKMKADKDRRVSPQVYHVGNGWTYIGGPSSIFMEEIKMAADVGVNIITFNIPACWLSPEKVDDWLPMDVKCQEILNVNPNALLLPRVGLDAPKWWLEANPDALMIFEDGSKGDKAAISHRKYRREACAHLEKLSIHLADTFPDKVIGIHPCGQNTGEWFYEDTWGRKLSGYDEATKTAWQAYSSGSGEVPSPSARRLADSRNLLKPTTDKDVIEFNRFLQDEMADFLIELSDAARRGIGPDKLILFFYGYQYEFGPTYNGPATSGHYALEKILNAPNIDILSAPISYYDRKLTGSGPVMTSVESVLRAGKYWLNEDDSRTYLNANTVDHNRYGGTNTQAETKSVLLRNATQSAIRGFGTWWMDHGAGTFGGWFADPELWKVMDEVMVLDNDMFTRKEFYNPEIALIMNEESMLHIAGGSDVLGRNLLYNAREVFSRSGTTFGQYLLNDQLEGNISSKMKVFSAVWALDAETRKALINSKKKDEMRVWCYAPGYITETGISLETMEELTGFNFERLMRLTAISTPTEEGINMGITNSWGPDKSVNPVFTVKPDSVIVLATYSNGKPSVAIKESNMGTDVFIGTPSFTSELIRALGKYCGIKLYAEEDVNVWSAENYLALHTAKEGELNLFVDNSDSDIYNALTGEKMGNDSLFTFSASSGETKLFRWNIATGVEEDNILPQQFSVSQNYPNPFNPSTKIEYSLPIESSVKIEIVNILGERVDIFTKSAEPAGKHKFTWNAANYPSGLYIIRIEANGINSNKRFAAVKKALLVK